MERGGVKGGAELGEPWTSPGTSSRRCCGRGLGRPRGCGGVAFRRWLVKARPEVRGGCLPSRAPRETRLPESNFSTPVGSGKLGT